MQQINYDERKELEKNFTPLTEKDFDKLGNFLSTPCKQLFRKNILTCWSGLSGDAHIGFEYEQLSSENKEVINKLVSEKDSPWSFTKIGHWGLDKPYDKIVWLAFSYENRKTLVKDLENQFIQQISYLKPQDLVIVDKMDRNRAKASCVRFTRKGMADYFGTNYALVKSLVHNGEFLYKNDDSEIPIYNVLEPTHKPEGTVEFKDVKTVISENGAYKRFIKDPKFYYDKYSDTFFRSYELLANSLKFRGLELPVETAVKYMFDEMDNTTQQTDELMIK